MSLSNKEFFNYMNKYTKLTQNFTFKSPNISTYPIKKNPKFLSIQYLKQINNKSDNKDNNDNIKINNSNSSNYINFNKINNYDNNNNNEEKTIQEKPYGFKYNKTRIIYDKSKIKAKSSLYKHNNSFLNITNLPNQKNRNKKNLYYKYSSIKEEKIKNKTFKYFSEGAFLHSQSGVQIHHSIISSLDNKIKNKNSSIIIKDYDLNNNIQILYDIIQNFKTDLSTNKTIKYNIANYYKNENFYFQVDIESLCLKFINQEEDIEHTTSNLNFHKLYLPFIYW